MERFFHSFGGLPEEEPENGIRIKTLVLENVRMRQMEFAPHTILPNHRHPEEVVTLVLEGTMEMTVGEEKKTVSKGDVFVVPAQTAHSGLVGDLWVVAV